jgi:hypothetical protein
MAGDNFESFVHVANPAIPMALDSECAKTRDLDMATYLNQTVLRERNQTMESIEDHHLLDAKFLSDRISGKTKFDIPPPNLK